MVRVLALLFVPILLPAADVTLPDSPADIARGAELYKASCLFCHGPEGAGGRSPVLAKKELTRARTDADLVRIIAGGLPGGMPAAPSLTEREVRQVAAYVRSLSTRADSAPGGDAVLGRALFFGKAGCSGCHAEDGPYPPKAIGPSTAFRLQPHAKPQAELRLADGAVLRGTILAQDSFHLLLLPDNGQLRGFPLNEIREIVRLPQRPWPVLTDSDKAHLTAFVQSTGAQRR